MTTASHDHYVKVQSRTLITADHLRERWTKSDIEYVMTHTEEMTDEDLAIAVGRSLAAIWNLQYRVRHEGLEGVLASFKRPEVKTCSSCFMQLLPTGACPTCE